MIRAQLNQAILKGGQCLPEARLKQVLASCTRVLKPKGSVYISVAFVSEAQMRKLNRQWRGKYRVTDVLSFRYDEEDLKGEIVVSYAQAKRQAMAMGHSTRDEVCFLLVHGVLHLFGYDHEKPIEAKKMFTLQNKILQLLNIDSRL
jgi:probable rRNA maturation factor